MDNQYKLIKTIYKLGGIERSVAESEIRSRWKKCPETNAILELGNDVYFEIASYSPKSYRLTAAGYTFFQNRRIQRLSVVVGLVTLAVTLATLVATVI